MIKMTCLSAVVVFCLLSGVTASAGTFTVTMPPGQTVTMNDPIDTLTFTITNTGCTTNPCFIGSVVFTFVNAQYWPEWDTVGPTGWTPVFSNGSSITFNANSNADRIPLGGSVTFSINVKGQNWGSLPRSNSDSIDSLNTVTATGTEAFARSGALPTWLRHSLAVTMTAFPDIVGIGQSFTLLMQVENRSLQQKSSIASAPSPPLAILGGGAAVALTAGPTYSPNPLTLNAGAQGTISFTYRADAPGTVSFSAGAAATGATSKTASSNEVVINPLAVSLDVQPLSVTSGSTVTVTMKVQNTGRTTTLSAGIDASTKTIFVASTAAFPSSGTISIDSEEISCTFKTAVSFRNCTRGVNGTTPAVHASGATVRSLVAFGAIMPTLTPVGTATATLLTGPTPTEIGSLFPDQSGAFTWTYRITGTIGQTYRFQGAVTADGIYTSNTVLSQQGMLARYAVTVSPDSVSTGSANVDFFFTFTNDDPTQRIRRINHYFPTGWTRVNDTPCAGWSSAALTGGRRFENAANPLAQGQSCTFRIRFNLPAVTADTTYAFYSDLYNTSLAFLTTLQSYVTVTAYRLTLTHAPAGPINADGTSTYTMTATLTSGGTGLAGRPIVFSTTAGRLAPTTANTNAAGVATSVLTAPISSTNVTGTVTAEYVKTKGTDTASFSGVAGPNMQYIGGSLTPLTVCKGYTYGFSLRAKNYGTAAMGLTTVSRFTFTDGVRTYTSYLDAGTAVNAGETKLLNFASPAAGGGGGGVLVNSAFTDGSYFPGIWFTDGAVTQQRTGDEVSVQPCVPLAGGKVKMLRWRELFR